jgi:signal transduction histidine kinase
VTLRTRFTLLTTVLLAVGLGSALVAYERLDSQEVESELDRRALALARTGHLAGGWLPNLKPEDFEYLALRGSPAASAPAREPTDTAGPIFSNDVEQPDGAYVESFLFVRLADQRPVARVKNATSRGVPLARRGRFLETARAFAKGATGRTYRVTSEGREFAVAVNDARIVAGADREPRPPPPPPRRPGEAPPADAPEDGPPGENDLDGPPPPPDDSSEPPSSVGPRPPPPNRGGGRLPPRFRMRPDFVGVAFIDMEPARDAHAARTWVAGGVGLCALAFGSLLAFALSGHMLRPIRAAAAAAEAIEKPSQRLPTRGSSDELERLVTVLNGMLARLDDASTRERHFLATASHELRRPLAALLGELELASAPGRAPSTMHASIGLAIAYGHAMRRLVDDLLHHARAQAGALRLAEADVELGDVVADAVDRSRRTIASGAQPADAANPTARIEVGAIPAITLRADPDALRQVFENLLVNGATHGGPGALVTISADPADPAEPNTMGLSIHIDDDGPGIPSDERSRIFEPFGRGDRARTVPGFGLGLAIACDLIVAHGGTIDVVSPLRPGDATHPGSRFTVRWPVARIRSTPR